MTGINQGGPAFPSAQVEADGQGNFHSIHIEGMTLHQYYARGAMETLIGGIFNAEAAKAITEMEENEDISFFDQVAAGSLKMADAMIAAYKKREEENEGD